MIELLLYVSIALLVLAVVLLVVLLRKKVTADLSPVEDLVHSVQASYDKTERTVRDEFANNREEGSRSSRESREELALTIKGFGDTISNQLSMLSQSNERKLEQVRQDSQLSAKTLRDEVGTSLKGFNDSIVNTVGELGSAQRTQLDRVVEELTKLTESNERKLEAQRTAVGAQLADFQAETRNLLDQIRQDSQSSAKTLREEVGTSLKSFNDSNVITMGEIGSSQRTQLGNVVEQLTRLTESNEKKLDAQRTAVDTQLKTLQGESGKKLDQLREDAATNAKLVREEVGSSLKAFNDSVLKGMGGMAELQKGQVDVLSGQMSKLVESNVQKLDGLKTAVEEKLKSIQDDNSKQLDQMRATVDEKLQSTLDKRLSESFKRVSDQLEQVHKGLGEMQTLASGVGDLKRVLTNVKTRGTWGEVQLEAMLEQVLTPEQYSKNVPTKDGGERVEFAIKFPGQGDDNEAVVWLPIDAKFPMEDYQRLVEAQEQANPEAAEAASKQLEQRVRRCASDIHGKYINPPKTTDFAILFLPTEGLFAEVVRRIGLTEGIQRESHIIIAGPTTLYSILNSLQMGFRTLAIQQRSSEVWSLLAGVKTEFGKYGEVLGKVQKKLAEASNTIDAAAVRTRAIERKLRDVQALPLPANQPTLFLGDEAVPLTESEETL